MRSFFKANTMALENSHAHRKATGSDKGNLKLTTRALQYPSTNLLYANFPLQMTRAIALSHHGSNKKSLNIKPL